MARHESKDFVVEIPEGWRDRTVVAYTAPSAPGETITPNVVINRDPVEGLESVYAYADQQLVELARRFDGFVLERRHERKVGGLPALETSFMWNSSGHKFRVRQVSVLLRSQTALTITATALERDFPRVDAQFSFVFNSLRIL